MSDPGEDTVVRARGRAAREELGMTAHIMAYMEANSYIEAGASDLLRALSMKIRTRLTGLASLAVRVILSIARLFRLRLSDALTDLIIVCGDRTWKTQKALACAHSGFLDLACKEGFKEGDTSVVELQEEDPVLVGHMIDYMYTLDWGETPPVETCDHGDQEHSHETKQCRLYAAKLCIAMHVLAEKYDMQGLKKLCVARFEVSGWSKLESDEILNLTEDVYNNTRESDELRRVVRELALSDIKSWSKRAGFRDFLRNTPDLAADAVMALAMWGNMDVLRRCSYCDLKKRVMVEFKECEGRGPEHDGGCRKWLRRNGGDRDPETS